MNYQKILSLSSFVVASTVLFTACQPQISQPPTSNPAAQVEEATNVETGDVEGQITEYQFVAETDGQTAADVLTSNAQVEFIDYDFGQFVQAINGLAGNDEYYWSFSVNGVAANQSVDNTDLQAGDTIEFVYQSVSDFDMVE